MTMETTPVFNKSRNFCKLAKYRIIIITPVTERITNKSKKMIPKIAIMPIVDLGFIFLLNMKYAK